MRDLFVTSFVSHTCFDNVETFFVVKAEFMVIAPIFPVHFILRLFIIYLFISVGSLRGLMATVLHCSFKVSDFELQTLYGTNSL